MLATHDAGFALGGSAAIDCQRQVEDAMAKFTAGDRVTHDVYGHGTIASTDEYHTRISFDEHGVRTFVASRVVLTRSTQPPPARLTSPRRKS
jgi:hypothetical protein